MALAKQKICRNKVKRRCACLRCRAAAERQKMFSGLKSARINQQPRERRIRFRW